MCKILKTPNSINNLQNPQTLIYVNKKKNFQNPTLVNKTIYDLKGKYVGCIGVKHAYSIHKNMSKVT
jgi:hypothetical protein